MPLMNPGLTRYYTQQGLLSGGGPAAGATQNAQLTGYARPGVLNPNGGGLGSQTRPTSGFQPMPAYSQPQQQTGSPYRETNPALSPPPQAAPYGGPLNQQAMSLSGGQGGPQPLNFPQYRPIDINPFDYTLGGGGPQGKPQTIAQYHNSDMAGTNPPTQTRPGLNPYIGQLQNLPQQQMPQGGSFNQLAMMLSRGR